MVNKAGSGVEEPPVCRGLIAAAVAISPQLNRSQAEGAGARDQGKARCIILFLFLSFSTASAGLAAPRDCWAILPESGRRGRCRRQLRGLPGVRSVMSHVVGVVDYTIASRSASCGT